VLSCAWKLYGYILAVFAQERKSSRQHLVALCHDDGVSSSLNGVELGTGDGLGDEQAVIVRHKPVGVAVHFWPRRSRGASERLALAEALLTFIEPMICEWDMDAVKGVDWGVKTLGRNYSDLVAEWLEQQVVYHQRRYRALMLHKALTYLSSEQRPRATGEAP
jgi:hypothetical protein